VAAQAGDRVIATFYLGTHQPHWLATATVPLFVSHRRLAGRKTFPRARTWWALDSGGFTELAMHGGWSLNPTDALRYVRAIRRYHDEIGNLQWAAPQDWMCEPGVIRITGRSIEEHQRLTCHNYCMIRSLWRGTPDVQVIPVLQGWTLDDYKRHYDMYTRTYRVDLEAQPLVGVGSVCRRSHGADIEQIFRVFARLRLHGFGVKTGGLRRYGRHLASADSMAWSYAARREPPLPGCTTHKNCANCPKYALAWRERVLKQMTWAAAQPYQPTLDEVCA
jgi:hypothetical protein